MAECDEYDPVAEILGLQMASEQEDPSKQAQLFQELLASCQVDDERIVVSVAMEKFYGKESARIMLQSCLAGPDPSESCDLDALLPWASDPFPTPPSAVDSPPPLAAPGGASGYDPMADILALQATAGPDAVGAQVMAYFAAHPVQAGLAVLGGMEAVFGPEAARQMVSKCS